jgi:hypothetical protein
MDEVTGMPLYYAETKIFNCENADCCSTLSTYVGGNYT